MSKVDYVEIRIANRIDWTYDSCKDCKWFDIPEEACKAMGCFHAWGIMYDRYETKEENK